MALRHFKDNMRNGRKRTVDQVDSKETTDEDFIVKRRLEDNGAGAIKVTSKNILSFLSGRNATGLWL